jgi:DNA invertase Pin-like site-specific DNA recombinase
VSRRSRRLHTLPCCPALATYGYARVSTDGQSLGAQLGQLKGAGCTKIFREKISGARADRPELAKLLKVLDAGDVVIVTRLDRLARSTRDLLNVHASIADRKAGFRSLGDAWPARSRATGAMRWARARSGRLRAEMSGPLHV